MQRVTLAGIVSCVLFGLVTLHEWSYARQHPHAYGPAVWITVGALAGAVLAAAVAYMAYELNRIVEQHLRNPNGHETTEEYLARLSGS